jgi:hypothetical protein
MQRLSNVVLLILLMTPVATAEEKEQETQAQRNPYRGGFVKFSAFFITNIDTEIVYDHKDSPLASRVDLQRDLGLSDSESVPRLSFAYRFNRRSMIMFEAHGVNRDATRVIDESFVIGDEIFELNETLYTAMDVELYKAGYSWVFHDDGKVLLALGLGLHVTDIDFEVRAVGDISDTEVVDGVTAPLPVISGQLGYQITRELRMGVLFDWLIMDYDRYNGAMQDARVVFTYRPWRRFGFTGGLNLFSINAEIDDGDFEWDIQHVYLGFVFGGKVFF